MEIKVGEYVRTESGKITRAKEVENSTIMTETASIRWISESNVKKHSPNIIELIEIGDYVNGYLINYIPDNEKAVYHDASDCADVEKFENKDIETIVTKEQFKEMEYKV